MNQYQNISCKDHSVLELAIMRAQSMQVNINSRIRVIQPIDLITQNGEEFLIYIDEKSQKQQCRADLITI